MPLSAETMALATKAGLLPAQQQEAPFIDAGTTTISAPQDPSVAPQQPPPAANAPGFWDKLKGYNQQAGQAVIDAVSHPADTAQAAWDANKRAGQYLLDANQRAGQGVINAVTGQGQAPAQPEAPPPAPPPQAPPQSLVTPMRIVPGHEVRAVSPTVEKMYGEAAGQEKSAADLAQMADMNSADLGAKGIQDISETYGKQVGAMQKREAERRARYEATQGEYDRINDEAMRGEVTPKQIGLMSRIGIALGAGGAALTHTPNAALEMVNKDIEQSIAAQRANIENKNRGAERAQGQLHDMRERFGDERQADAAEFARQLEEHKAAGDALVARAQSPVLAAKWDMVKAGMSKQQAALHNQMFPWMPTQAVGGVAQKPLDNVFMNVDGQRYQARDATSRAKLVKSVESVQDLQSQIRDYHAALSKLSNLDKLAYKSGINTDAMSAAQTAYTRILTTARQAADEGVYKKSEEPQFERQLVSPSSFTGDPEKQMEVSLKGLNDMHAHTMQAEDPLPVEQRFVQTPRDGIQPRNPYTGGVVPPQAAPASSFIKPLGAK